VGRKIVWAAEMSGGYTSEGEMCYAAHADVLTAFVNLSRPIAQFPQPTREGRRLSGEHVQVSGTDRQFAVSLAATQGGNVPLERKQISI